MICILLTSCAEKEYNYPYEAMSKGCEIHDFYLPDLNMWGKQEKDGYIALITQRNDDVNPLKNQRPRFWISAAASVTPDSSIAQNFLDTVHYTVTSEAGITKVWKVYHKYRDYTEAGIGEIDSLWYKDNDQLGLTRNNENTIAILGDKLVFSRSGVVIDKMTGIPTGERLNMTGIDAGKGNAAQNIPFCLANDDAGNLLGCTLGAWSAPYFRVYKWEDVNQPPTLVIDHEGVNEPIGGDNGTTDIIAQYGRKLVAQGDITQEGIVGSFAYNTNGFHSFHDFWGVSANQYNNKTFRVGTGYKGKNNYQKAFPLRTTEPYPYYYADGTLDRTTSLPITTLRYVWLEGEEKKECEILGPLLEHPDDIGNGWGKSIMDSKLFTFYGKQYLAVLYATNKSYFVSVLDPGDNPQHPRSYKEIMHSSHAVDFVISNPTAGNGNATTSIAVSERVDPDGVTRMTLYAFMTNTGVICYEFNNYAPEEE